MVIVIVVETKSTVNIISTVVLISDSKNYTLYTSPFGSRSDRFSMQGHGLHSRHSWVTFIIRKVSK